ncbi:MAG: pantetheine-phosphate adenylyltransferase [Microgenomates group bacterium]
MSYIYNSAILGGTFDHFHIGHETFIKAAFENSLHVTIGIVETPFSNAKSYSNSIESYALRIKNISTFLNKSGLSGRFTLIPIHDIYGTTLIDKSIETIFVTSSTAQNADLINKKRTTLDLPPLKIIVVPHVKADDGQIISSSRIRAGEINHDGASYLQFFLQKKSYHLPASLRPTLQTPLGPVIQYIKDLPVSQTIIAIGDVVSMDLIQAGYTPALCIIDYHTRRESLSIELVKQYFPRSDYEIPNPAGTINPDFANIFLSALADYHQTPKTQTIAVDGEEDLLALPALLLAPLGTSIVYGQPKLGMIAVKVTPEIKAKVKQILGSFISQNIIVGL